MGDHYEADVDLMPTKYALLGYLAIGETEDDYEDIDALRKDLRAIRRAILDLDDFQASEK